MSDLYSPIKNYLLAALTEETKERISPNLEAVQMLVGETLYEPGRKSQHIYFPTTSIVSLSYMMESGESSEVSSIGNEGLLGISFFLGDITTNNHATVSAGGYGYRMEHKLMVEEFNRAGPMMRLILRYTQALMTQMSQTTGCNWYHSVAQQLCRWMLLTMDRLPSKELVMMQEMVASILGVRRESITQAAGKLQRIGVISYRQDHIKVLDQAKLESCACECYSVVKKEFSHLLSNTER